jgi:hypothetical protein
MTILYEDSILPFGKHKGSTVAAIATEDPDHLRRIQISNKQYSISDEVMLHLDKYSSSVKDYIPGSTKRKL